MAPRPQIERIDVKLPSGFDPAKHVNALTRKIIEQHGPGWEITNINPAQNTAYAERQITIAEVQASTTEDTIDVRLAKATKPGDGEKMAAKLEQQHEGYRLTAFEPFLGYAIMTKLSDQATRARGALAVALGVKPWDIQIQEQADGGFKFTLPKTYVPSKHEDKLQEVAESVVGREGWYVRANAQKLTAEIVPADPPTFPAMIPYPFKAKVPAFSPASPAWAQIPVGERLATQGGQRGEVLLTDFVANPMMQISGVTGGGKGVLLTSLAAGALARGWELGLVDAVKGGVDFTDITPFCRTGFFAEDLPQACAVLAMAYEEGQRRKALIKQHRVQKFAQLPASLGLKPLMIIVDEATSLLLTSPIPKGIDKESELAIEIATRNTLMATSLEWMGKIARELRFTAVSLILSTQVASSTVGIPTELRANLGAKFLLGASPTPNNRRLALSAPDAVPDVPRNIAVDENGAARGVGVFEREGSKPGVFKAYFSPPPDFGAWLNGMGVPQTSRPNPSAAEIAKYTPSLEVAGEPASRMREEVGGFGRDEKRGRRDDGLSGAAAAAHDANVENARFRKEQAERDGEFD